MGEVYRCRPPTAYPAPYCAAGYSLCQTARACKEKKKCGRKINNCAKKVRKAPGKYHKCLKKWGRAPTACARARRRSASARRRAACPAAEGTAPHPAQDPDREVQTEVHTQLMNHSIQPPPDYRAGRVRPSFVRKLFR